MFKLKFIVVIATISITQSIFAEKLTPSSLINKYAATQDKLQSFILKSKTVSEYENSFTSNDLKHLSGHKTKIELDELRCDGNRLKLIKQHWENIEDSDNLPSDKAVYNSWLWDGEQTVNNAYSPIPGKSDNVTIVKGKNFTTTLIQRDTCGPMMGFFHGDDIRVDSILGKSTHRVIRAKMEKIADSQCYVIDGLTRNGKYTIWIDPNHDYHIAKAVVSRKPGNLFYGKAKWPEMQMSVSMENVRFEKIDDVWVPVESDRFFDIKYNRLDSWKMKQHYKVLQMTLKPDFDKLNAFSTDDIRNGARVYISEENSNELRKGKFVWQDGKIVKK